MSKPGEYNEELAAAAFTKQAVEFDRIYSSDTIIRYKRERVRNHLAQFLQPNSKILELNAGTGEDAVWLSSQSHMVHATDNSLGMLKVLQNKITGLNLMNFISTEKCSFTDLTNLKNKGPYDYIFSNFAGLNCTDQLSNVLLSFQPLLKKNGMITLVILPPFCLWELLMLFKGKFKTAFRRFNSKNGREANIDGLKFKCWYYKPSFVVETLKDNYELVSLEGLCSFVPPSYIENFGEKHPVAFKRLVRLENKLKTKWPWRSIGDYYIISLRKKT